MKNTTELNSFLSTFEYDSFPELRVGHICYLFDIRKLSIGDLLKHIYKACDSNTATGNSNTELESSLNRGALETKLRRLIDSYKKKKRANLSRSKNQENLRDFLTASFVLSLSSQSQALGSLASSSVCAPQPRPLPVVDLPLRPTHADVIECGSVTTSVSSVTTTVSTLMVSVSQPTSSTSSADPPLTTVTLASHTTATASGLRGDCSKCPKLRASTASTVLSLKEELKATKRECRDTKQTYEVKRISLFKKRKADQLRRKNEKLKRQKLDINALRSNASRATLQTIKLQNELKLLKKKVTRLEKEKEGWKRETKEKMVLRKQVIELEEALALNDISEGDVGDEEDTTVCSKVKKCYTNELRRAVYNCLQNQVPVECIGQVIKYTVSALTNYTIKSILLMDNPVCMQITC